MVANRHHSWIGKNVREGYVVIYLRINIRDCCGREIFTAVINISGELDVKKY